MLSGKLAKEARAAARRFQPVRARQTTEALFAKAHGMDSAAVGRAAEFLVAELRQAGFDQAGIEMIPADGTTQYGGWLMPISWSVQEARLEGAAPVLAGVVLADYALDPLSIALYSPATPGNGWVEGPVVLAPDVKSVRNRLRGAFLFLTEGMGSFEINEAAARAGALGILGTVPNDNRTASRYGNYAVTLAADRPCVPCFSLSTESAESLRAHLGGGAEVRVRARVRVSREAGTFPLVTATLGQGTPSLYLCGHMDEPGAQDNASGVAAAIETARTLRELSAESGFSPALRSVKLMFSVEVRGLQAWVNRTANVPAFQAGLNLDMVGHSTVPIVLRGGFRDQPHFGRYLLGEAGRIADALVKGVASKAGANFVSDAVLKLGSAPAHVSVEQVVDSSYHNSSDLPALLDLKALQWAGAVSVAFLYALTRLDNDGVLSWARAIRESGENECRTSPEKAPLIARRIKAELRSLSPLMRLPGLHGAWRTAAEVYARGVRRSTGCWPAVEKKGVLDALIAEPVWNAPVSGPPASGVATAARREAESLVPQALFNGYLAFEDQWRPAQAARLKKELGLTPGWGTEPWAWMLARHLRGKSTLAEVVDGLGTLGVGIDMEKAVALTRFLVRTKKASLKPVLTASLLRERIKAIGIKRGGILVVHSSLSHYGYVQGGAATLVQVLLDLLGPRGTLVMPTHSINVLGNLPYDRAKSPSLVGAVTEYFRTQPGVLRSAHPTHSVAAFGPEAVDLTSAHKVDMSPMAREGFWGRLVDLDGEVLLLCPMRSATLFHAGEDWTHVPQPVLVAHALGEDGQRRVYVLPHAPWHVDHFQSTLADPLLKRGVMRKARLGDGVFFRAPARAMADISVKVNHDNPRVSLGKNGHCNCFYCETVRTGLAGGIAG